MLPLVLARRIRPCSMDYSHLPFVSVPPLCSLRVCSTQNVILDLTVCFLTPLPTTSLPNVCYSFHLPTIPHSTSYKDTYLALVLGNASIIAKFRDHLNKTLTHPLQIRSALARLRV